MRKLSVLTIIASLLIAVNGWCGNSVNYSVSLASIDNVKATATISETRSFSRQVIADGYFDTRTGHRYFKTPEGTYDEFNKKGEFFKNVPSDLPLLVKGAHIRPISSDSYITYQRKVDGLNLQMVLPANEVHPENWKAVTILAGME